ncbi:MAG: HEAT repeat domain-containing protein [Deltaproteobacteria bacterium]|nr:HEAT repeat domain-containing protein [Deltaproteobacteria bacterium]
MPCLRSRPHLRSPFLLLLGVSSVALVANLALVEDVAFAAEGAPCAGLGRRIRQAVEESTDARAQLWLAPYAGAAAVDGLLARARSGDDADAFAAFFAVGLSRDVEALRRLRHIAPPKPGLPTLGWALGLLALGDGSMTATIAKSLRAGPVSVRRRVAETLALLPQKRPRMLLYESLVDADPQVRLAAAEVHVKQNSRRARRVLLELLRSSRRTFRNRAGYALLHRRYRFSSEELAMLPEGLRVQALVAHAVGARRPNRKLLRQQILGTDPGARVAALAVVAATGAESRGSLARLRRLVRARRGPGAAAEASMAMALLDEQMVDTQLAGFNAAQAERATLVFFGFAAGGAPHNQLEPSHALRLAAVFGDWIQRSLISDELQSLMLLALDASDASAGLVAARTRLASRGDGEGLRTAVKIVGRSGNLRDVPTLLGLLSKIDAKSRTRAELLRASAQSCEGNLRESTP